MNNNSKFYKAIVVVHGIGEQKHFETLFEFSDGFHRVMRDIIKDYGESIKKDLLENTGDDPKKPYLANAVLRVCESYLKQSQKLVFTPFIDSINNRLDDVLKEDPQKLKEVKSAFAGKESVIFEKAQDLEEILTLDYKYKLFPRGIGIERDGFAEVSHIDKELHLYEFWWAPDIKKPGMPSILLWLLKTAFKTIGKKHFLKHFPSMLFASVVVLTAQICYFLCLGRKLIKKALVDAFGDVKVYISDRKESEKIKNGLKRKISELSAKDEIDEILIIGHSLGSVISFDSLRELIKSNIQTKVKRFYSVGSPLDKIAYFWSEDYGKDVVDILKKQGIAWFNHYAPFDIVSGVLDSFGAGVVNEEFYNGLSPLTAHVVYWKNKAVMENIIRDAFVDDKVFFETEAEKKERKNKNKSKLKKLRLRILLSYVFWFLVLIVIFWLCISFPKFVVLMVNKLF